MFGSESCLIINAVQRILDLLNNGLLLRCQCGMWSNDQWLKPEYKSWSLPASMDFLPSTRYTQSNIPTQTL